MNRWDWGLFPEAEAFLNEKIDTFLAHNEFASTLTSIVERGTSTRIFDWVDHLTIPRDEVEMDKIAKIGFRKKGASSGGEVFRVEGSTLFPIILGENRSWELAITPESLDDFSRFVSSVSSPSISGAPYASLRRMVLKEGAGFVFSAVERRGCPETEMGEWKEGKSGDEEDGDTADYISALRMLSARRRPPASSQSADADTDEEGLREVEALIGDLTRKIAPSRVADAFFRAEREYWTAKNYAAQVQKLRQDAVGLGWGNADHHTYRSSRRNFASLVGIFKLMGLEPRERFYAGSQAGWGAQILEQPNCGKVVFTDVDLGEGETFDFREFEEGSGSKSRRIGTVGLWVALNGESILQAGMHHLAARFRFGALRDDLQRKGVGMMKPFSDFPFLRQAFSQIEYWKVDPGRANALMRDGRISREDLTKFLDSGAIGSHLENIERNQGFKGFNQDSVSVIIRLTDPRAAGKAA